jgi:hypothetical protein
VKLETIVACPGGQGDVSIWGHLAFMSVEGYGRLDCGSDAGGPAAGAMRACGAGATPPAAANASAAGAANPPVPARPDAGLAADAAAPRPGPHAASDLRTSLIR